MLDHDQSGLAQPLAELRFGKPEALVCELFLQKGEPVRGEIDDQ